MNKEFGHYRDPYAHKTKNDSGWFGSVHYLFSFAADSILHLDMEFCHSRSSG